MTVFRIEKLDRPHAVDAFECSEPALNRFLTRFALASQQSNAAATYVGLADDRVIGFYSLVVGEVHYDGAPERLTKGMARHPVPLMLLARLAVDQGSQGRGIGAGLLKDAMLRTVRAADIAGIRALAVHAKDEKARAFYQHFDFIDAPSDPLHLFLLVKDLRRYLSGQANPSSSERKASSELARQAPGQRLPGRGAGPAGAAPVHGLRQRVPGLDGSAGAPRTAQRGPA